jgi:hypothetical protein
MYQVKMLRDVGGFVYGGRVDAARAYFSKSTLRNIDNARECHCQRKQAVF